MGKKDEILCEHCWQDYYRPGEGCRTCDAKRAEEKLFDYYDVFMLDSAETLDEVKAYIKHLIKKIGRV